MGNALRFLYQHCHEPTITGDSESLGPHGVSASTVGVPALAQDLFQFETTSQVFFFCLVSLLDLRTLQKIWLQCLTLVTYGSFCKSFELTKSHGQFTSNPLKLNEVSGFCFTRSLKDSVNMLSLPRRLKLIGNYCHKSFCALS